MSTAAPTAARDVASREDVVASGPRAAAGIVRVVVWAAIIAAATAAQLLRQTGLHPWQTVWAEDGIVFFSETRSLAQVFDGFAGYLQLVPRLIGYASHWFPLDDLARYLAFAGALVTTLCGVAVWHFSRLLVNSKVLRAVLALSVVLLPTLVGEQLGNGVNTIWALTFAGWWAILYRPRSIPDAVPAAAVAFFAVTSNALVLTFVPVLALLVWHRRDKPACVVGGAFGAGMLIQLAVMSGADGAGKLSPTHASEIPKIFVVRVLGTAVVGEHWVAAAWNELGVGFAVLAAVVVVVVVGGLAWKAPTRLRWIGLVTVVYAVALWLISAVGRGTDFLRITEDGYHDASLRLTSISIWLLMSAIFVLVTPLRPGTAKRVIIAALAAQFVIVAVVGFRGSNPRSLGPSWEASLNEARTRCRAPGAAGTETFIVSIPPTPNWAVEMRCGRPPRGP